MDNDDDFDASSDATNGVGHAELDQQHELLRKSFERFVDMALDAKQRDGAVASLRELLVQVGLHFGFEESLMTKSGYPEFDHHLRQHLSMMTELGLLLDRLEDSTDQGVVRQIDFVVDWYQRHVDFSDRKFAIWLGR